MANRYNTGRHQKREDEIHGDSYVERDGILMGEDYLCSLYLNAHPVHHADAECDYDHEVAQVRSREK